MRLSSGLRLRLLNGAVRDGTGVSTITRRKRLDHDNPQDGGDHQAEDDEQ